MKIWMEDLFRYTGQYARKSMIKQILFNHEYRLVWLLRKCGTKLGFIYRIWYRSISRKYGIDVSPKTQIGKGFYMGHAYGITINSHAVLGNNVNIHKGATIGRANRGDRMGSPIIGNDVFIGINSTIVGNVRVGNNVLIAPNAYVNVDIPDDSIVIGNPGIIIKSENATKGYINRRV